MEKLKAACGGAHLIVLIISVASTFVLVGIAWGTLTSRMTAMDEKFIRFREEDAIWKGQEFQIDSKHRDQFNRIETMLFELSRKQQQ